MVTVWLITKRCILSLAQTDNFDDSMFGTLEGMKFKPLNPIFGFRGRSPIEREKSLDVPIVRSLDSLQVVPCAPLWLI
jgi:hypothetical protein